MKVIIEKRLGEEKNSQRITVTVDPSVSVRMSADIVEIVRNECTNLPLGKYQGEYNSKTLELKISKIDVEA